MTIVQVELWSSMLSEAKELFPLHWKEIALFQEQIGIDVDEAKYAALEKADILLTLTARSEGKLVGYFTWFLMPHLHYANAGLMGITDMYYILPEHRNGTGIRLFLESEKALKARGVVKAITSCKVHQNHSALLTRLGWELTDFTFCKYIGGR